MAHIVFVLPDGSRVAVNAPDGATLKDAAGALAGGGSPTGCAQDAQCLSCLCHPDPAYALVLPPMSSAERGLLEAIGDRRATTRLACRIRVNGALDGLTVDLAQPPPACAMRAQA